MSHVEGLARHAVETAGDALPPATIAAAIHDGHRYARELDEPPADGVPFRREFPRV